MEDDPGHEDRLVAVVLEKGPLLTPNDALAQRLRDRRGLRARAAYLEGTLEEPGIDVQVRGPHA
jgi:hypothetical protein